MTTWTRPGGTIPEDVEPWLAVLLSSLATHAQGRSGTFFTSVNGRQYRVVAMDLDKRPSGATPPSGTALLVQILGQKGRGDHWFTLFAVASNGDVFYKGAQHASFDFGANGLEPQ